MKIEDNDWGITKVGHFSGTTLTSGTTVSDDNHTTDYVYWTDDNTGGYSTGTTYSWTNPEGEVWPEVENAVGIIYVDDDKIKIKTKSAEEIVIADISEGQTEVIVSLMAVIAKKKLEELSDNI